MRKTKVTREKILGIINESFSVRDVISNLGYRTNSGTMFYRVKEVLANNPDIDTSHFGTLNKNQVYSNDEIFRKKSKYRSTHALKIRIRRDNLLEYRCFECGNKGDWNNKELILQLDHIDGDPSNHELSNLRYLCPNCHSQTHNFCGKNKAKLDKPKKSDKLERKKKGKRVYVCKFCGKETHNKHYCNVECAGKSHRVAKDRPSRNELAELIKRESFCAIGRKFGVSDNAVRKWVKSYNL